ncbi:MAG: hypothetical protein IPM39_24290 [Chloroflexi bacterium]|nr:hypothetical protein [Chloroflexota bacterium]
MNKSIKLGSLADLKILVKPSAILSIALVWLAYSLIGRKAFKLKPGQAILGGFLATLLHWFSELWHNLGHAQAAKQTGYPMSGICFTGPLAQSLYPPQEPTLPPHIHIRRALGGPIASAGLTLIFGGLALAAKFVGGVPFMVASITFLDNLLVFSLGAFLPLGFTDGSTLLRYMNYSQRPSQWLTVVE